MRPAVVTAVLLLVGVLDTVTAQPDDTILQPPRICQRYEDMPCDDGWSYIDRRCAKYFDTPKTFKEAQDHCRSLNSDLVSIHNEDEMYYVLCFTWVANPELKAFWIGAERSGLRYRYVDGSQFRFRAWHRGEPNNANGNEFCIESNFMEWGYWNDADCSEMRNFVCAKNM